MHREPAPGMSVHRQRRVADIFKRRLLALCSDVQKCRSFNHVQDLATIDVLRDIDYPSCAYLVRLLRIYMCAYAYLNYVARENVYIRRGLRVVGLTWWAMRQPLNVERQQSESTLFVCLYVTLSTTNINQLKINHYEENHDGSYEPYRSM